MHVRGVEERHAGRSRRGAPTAISRRRASVSPRPTVMIRPPASAAGSARRFEPRRRSAVEGPGGRAPKPLFRPSCGAGRPVPSLPSARRRLCRAWFARLLQHHASRIRCQGAASRVNRTMASTCLSRCPGRDFTLLHDGQTQIGRTVPVRQPRRRRRRTARVTRRRASAVDRRRQRPGTGRAHQRRAARGGAVAVSELRAVGDHGARAARRARRPEAGAAPHPLHDVAAEPDRRREAPEVREGRRRRDGQLPSARRRRALRNARAHGAVLLAALPARRRLGQLRLARRRQRRGDALHRVPARRGSATKCSPRSSRPPCSSGRTTTAPRPSRSCCRRGSRTCSSTAPPASPSAWPPTFRRTTSAKCARRSSSCSTTRISAARSCAATSRAPTFRPAARS